MDAERPEPGDGRFSDRQLRSRERGEGGIGGSELAGTAPAAGKRPALLQGEAKRDAAAQTGRTALGQEEEEERREAEVQGKWWRPGAEKKGEEETRGSAQEMVNKSGWRVDQPQRQHVEAVTPRRAIFRCVSQQFSHWVLAAVFRGCRYRPVFVVSGRRKCSRLYCPVFGEVWDFKFFEPRRSAHFGRFDGCRAPDRREHLSRRIFFRPPCDRVPESPVQVLHDPNGSKIRAGTQCEFARSTRVPGSDTSPVTESPEVMTSRRWRGRRGGREGD